MTGHLVPRNIDNLSLIKDEFFTPIESLFDSMMTNFFADFKPLQFTSVKSRAYPRIDAYKEGNDLVVEAIVANVKPENLKVELVDGNLIIQGSVETREENNGRYYYHTELFRSKFRRSFPINAELYEAWIKRTEDKAEVDAELKNGVLTIKLKDIFETHEAVKDPPKEVNIRIVE